VDFPRESTVGPPRNSGRLVLPEFWSAAEPLLQSAIWTECHRTNSDDMIVPPTDWQDKISESYSQMLQQTSGHKKPVSPSSSSRAVRTGPLLAPAVIVLLGWMIIPLSLTLWFSFQYYNLLDPFTTGFAGTYNYSYLLSDSGLWLSIVKTLTLLAAVLGLSIIFGVAFALIFDVTFYGRGLARLLVIAPFFVMPTVSALI